MDTRHMWHSIQQSKLTEAVVPFDNAWLVSVAQRRTRHQQSRALVHVSSINDRSSFGVQSERASNSERIGKPEIRMPMGAMRTFLRSPIQSQRLPKNGCHGHMQAPIMDSTLNSR